MTEQELLEAIKRTILELEPSAQTWLYGSRARNQAGPESDWDLLVLVEGPVDEARKRKIRHRLYEIEWACGEVISCIVRSWDEWNQPIMKVTPFHQHVTQEGIGL
ncbi:MAG TPA: nucleotidyltransferase domain-containing protein [Terriglobia bacterium]|nr:nucleotidyltransferase domain-containing protein [Terriglobia bacterium]